MRIRSRAKLARPPSTVSMSRSWALLVLAHASLRDRKPALRPVIVPRVVRPAAPAAFGKLQRGPGLSFQPPATGWRDRGTLPSTDAGQLGGCRIQPPGGRFGSAKRLTVQCRLSEASTTRASVEMRSVRTYRHVRWRAPLTGAPVPPPWPEPPNSRGWRGSTTSGAGPDLLMLASSPALP